MILMYRIIQELIGIDLSIFTVLSDLEIHFPPLEAINIRFLSIQFIIMLEPTFLPAELPTCGMTYHQKLSKLHH